MLPRVGYSSSESRLLSFWSLDVAAE